MTTASTPVRPSFRAPLAALALTLFATACAPRQDPFHPDQAPDINYHATELKDAKHIGSIPLIDSEVTTRMQGRFPGCAIAIVDGGEIAYLKGYGIADFKQAANPNDDVPFTKNTVAGIGSVSKVLTAMAVLRLAELGYVGLDDPVANYFPHWTPAGWAQITVKQLLSHRAGLARDPDFGLPGTIPPAVLDLYFGPKSSQHPRYGVLEFLVTAKAVPVPSAIGSYSYSNIGYVMLGAIVDWVTQMPAFSDQQRGYERFVWSLLAGADDAAITACLDHPWRAGDIPDLAQSYTANWNPLDTPFSGWQSAAGGWSMTIGDLARVLIALQGNQILSAQSLQAMRTDPGGFQDPSGYGLGLFLTPKAGRVAYHHGGKIDGFRTQVIVWPGEDVAVAVFANADVTGVGAIAEEVGRIWIEQGPFLPQLDRLDVAFQQTATFRVSARDFSGAEDLVQGLLGRLGEQGTASHLAGLVGGQSALGRSLVDLVMADPGRIEDAASLFLDTLTRDGHVGPYTRR